MQNQMRISNHLHLMFLTAIFFFSFVNIETAFAMPLNLSYEKNAIIEYYTSNTFDKEVSAALQDANYYMIKRVAENNDSGSPKQLAIVLDIDDTSLTNFYAFKDRDFSNLPLEIADGYKHGNLPAIIPTLKLYQSAINNNIHVFFVSFRPETYLPETKRNLIAAGYQKWDDIVLPSIKEFKMNDPIDFKTTVRKEIEDSGYTIILNIGDQDSDLVGGYAEKTVKIPNPLYAPPPAATRAPTPASATSQTKMLHPATN